MRVDVVQKWMKDVFETISTKQDETLELIKKKKIEYEVVSPDIEVTVDTEEIEKVIKKEFKKQLKKLDEFEDEKDGGDLLKELREIKYLLSSAKFKDMQEFYQKMEERFIFIQANARSTADYVKQLHDAKTRKHWWQFWKSKPVKKKYSNALKKKK